MSYKRLANAYSIPALVNYGFTWSHLLQLGIDVDDLHSVTSDEFRLLRVTAQELLAFGPHVAKQLFQEARDAGADEVLPRGAFDRSLPDILLALGSQSSN